MLLEVIYELRWIGCSRRFSTFLFLKSSSSIILENIYLYNKGDDLNT